MINLYSKEKKTENIAEDHNEDENVVLHNPLESIINAENNKDDEIESVDVTSPSENKPKDTPPTSKPETDSKKSYISIVNDYNSKFESLRSNFEGDLNNLLVQGAADYSSGKVSSAKLAATYMSSGATLEKASDVKFKAIVKEMEKDLKNNGHDTAIVKEIESYYTSFKNSKKSALISKGMDHLN